MRQRALGAGAGLCAVVAAAGGFLVTAGPARAAVAPGVGNAYAQSFQDTPKDGSLQVGVVLAEAIAGHTNEVARAQSQGVDLTAIGSSLQGYNCNTAPSQTQVGLVPQPLQTETGEQGAASGITEDPTYGVNNESSTQPVPPTFGSTEYVKATGDPYGEADTSYGSIAVPGTPFSVSGMKSSAWSGLVNGARVAAATSDINSVNFLNGMVVLNGLHWSVTYPSGGSDTPTASFTIASMTINGTSVPTPDATTALGEANTVLQPLGLQLNVPQSTSTQGYEFEGPLAISVVPNQTRDQILDGALSTAGPKLGPIEGGLENGFSPSEPAPLVQALCQSDTPITVADIAVASVDGGGSYTTSLGGVDASSGDAPSNPFNLSLPSFGAGSTVQYVPGTPAVPATPGTPAVAASTGAASAAIASTGLSSSPSAAPTPASTPPASSPTAAQQSNGVVSPQPIAAIGHAAGGPLLGIGLAGLCALALLAEGDRRLIRRSQRGSFSDTFSQ